MTFLSKHKDGDISFTFDNYIPNFNNCVILYYFHSFNVCFVAEGSEGSLINSNLNIEIKEEPIDMDMVNLDSIWNREEISKCMEVYNMQKIKLEAFSDDGEFWKFISEELENAGIYKTPSECEKVCNHFEKDKRREKVPNRIANGNSGSHQSGGETQEDSDNLDRNQGNIFWLFSLSA